MNTPSAHHRPAYVLAGGGSTRLGRDKARARLVGDTTVIEAVIASFDGAFSRWTVVADEADKFSDLGLRTIADQPPGRGPLGGILRAVEDADEEYTFIVSCDRVGLKRRWVTPLAEALAGGPPAVSYRFDGRKEPLFAFYRTDLAPTLTAFIDRGGRAVWRFLDEIESLTIDAPPGWAQTFSINTPEQLHRARMLFTKRQRS